MRKTSIVLGALPLFLTCFLPVLAFGQGLEGLWLLEKSIISYQVTHPFHEATGKSLSARGKGVCYGRSEGQFLVAVPVKSFESGDANRDLHMLEVTRAGLYPWIQVRVEVTVNGEDQPPKQLNADAKIQFAGKTTQHLKIQLNVLEWTSGEVHLSAAFPISLKDFGIEPPSLLGMPIRDKVPIMMDMWWKRMGPAPEPSKN